MVTGSFTTGSLPSEVALSLTVKPFSRPFTLEHLLFPAGCDSAGQWLVIANSAGQVVWYEDVGRLDLCADGPDRDLRHGRLRHRWSQRLRFDRRPDDGLGPECGPEPADRLQLELDFTTLPFSATITEEYTTRFSCPTQSSAYRIGHPRGHLLITCAPERLFQEYDETGTVAWQGRVVCDFGNVVGEPYRGIPIDLR